MKFLMCILIVLAIVYIAMHIFFEIRNRHFQNQYDQICNELEMVSKARQNDLAEFRRIVKDRDAEIARLNEMAMQNMTFKVTTENGQNIIAKQVQEENNEAEEN